MADIAAQKGARNRQRATADSGRIELAATRTGDLFTADYIMGLALQGRVFGVNVGTGTTPTAMNATYAAAEPDLWVHVPSGTTIIPIYLAVGFEDTGTAQVMDVLAVASATGDAAVTGTALTIYNLRTDALEASGCTATAVVTAAGTDPHAGNFIEFWRPYAGFSEDGFNGSTFFGNNMVHGASWSYKTAGYVPIIPGTGSLSVYASAQAGTGFITAIWAEIPTTDI